jgi:hypothetical protein
MGVVNLDSHNPTPCEPGRQPYPARAERPHWKLSMKQKVLSGGTETARHHRRSLGDVKTSAFGPRQRTVKGPKVPNGAHLQCGCTVEQATAVGFTNNLRGNERVSLVSASDRSGRSPTVAEVILHVGATVTQLSNQHKIWDSSVQTAGESNCQKAPSKLIFVRENEDW